MSELLLTSSSLYKMALLSRVLHQTQSPPSITSSHSHVSPTSSILSHSSITAPKFSLNITLESPPVVLYGNPSESTGSIISGILTLDIKPPKYDRLGPTISKNSLTAVSSNSSIDPPPFAEVELENVTLSLVQTIKYSKTFCIPSSSVNSCKDCCLRKTTLARWDVLTSTASFMIGSHAYPFSHLLPGSLPPSTKLGSTQSISYIKYDLIAVGKSANFSKPTTVRMPLNISRLILRGPDRNSLRVFPPTEVTSSAVLPNVIYPKSTFPVELKLDNIVSNSGDRRWRMRKLAWRVEEVTKVRAYACEKHLAKLKHTEESQRKAELHKELATGLKTSSIIHHSTILAGMSILSNPNPRPSGETSTETSPNQDITLGAEDSDREGTLRSGPSRAAANFEEDFLRTASATGAPHAADAAASPPSENPNVEQLYLEESRTVNHGEIKSGWKSDFNGRGVIELVADIIATNFSTGYIKHISKCSSDDAPKDDLVDGLRNGANVSCDIEDPTLGVYVNHTLIVEVIVAEELLHSVVKKGKRSDSFSNLVPVSSNQSASTPPRTPVSGPASARNSPHPSSQQTGVPTGAARVLRMQFKLPLTERSGLGIAWDDEVPPTYEDVRTLSPPTYFDSGSSTPINPPAPATTAPSNPRRTTVGVIDGVGNTPGMGNFGLNRSAFSIDQMVDLDERIQEFYL